MSMTDAKLSARNTARLSDQSRSFGRSEGREKPKNLNLNLRHHVNYNFVQRS